VISLGSWSSTIELHPRIPAVIRRHTKNILMEKQAFVNHLM